MKTLSALTLTAALLLAPSVRAEPPSPPTISLPKAPPLPQGQVMPFAIGRDQGTVTYLVVDSVKPHEGLVDFQSLIVWAQPKDIDGFKLEQSLITQQLDCKAQTVQRLGAAVYDDTGVGLDTKDAGKKAAEPWPQGSGLASLAKTLCEGGELDSKLILEGGSQTALKATRYLMSRPAS